MTLNIRILIKICFKQKLFPFWKIVSTLFWVASRFSFSLRASDTSASMKTRAFSKIGYSLFWKKQADDWSNGSLFLSYQTYHWWSIEYRNNAPNEPKNNFIQGSDENSAFKFSPIERCNKNAPSALNRIILCFTII